MNPRRAIVLTCSVLLVLLGAFLAFRLQTAPGLILGLTLAASGVYSFAKAI